MENIPCRNCLTLAVCKGLFEDYRFDSTKGHFVAILMNKCLLMKTYISSSDVDIMFNVYEIYDFFAEGN